MNVAPKASHGNGGNLPESGDEWPRNALAKAERSALSDHTNTDKSATWRFPRPIVLKWRVIRHVSDSSSIGPKSSAAAATLLGPVARYGAGAVTVALNACAGRRLGAGERGRGKTTRARCDRPAPGNAIGRGAAGSLERQGRRHFGLAPCRRLLPSRATSTARRPSIEQFLMNAVGHCAIASA